MGLYYMLASFILMAPPVMGLVRPQYPESDLSPAAQFPDVPRLGKNKRGEFVDLATRRATYP